MTKATAKVFVEIEAHLQSVVSVTDYGVPRSPKINEFLETELVSVELFGRTYTKEDLAGLTAWDFLEDGLILEVEEWTID
jgi:hypothetical protein